MGPLKQLLVVAFALAATLSSAAAAPQSAPLRIFLRGGPKTHGPADNGQHDGPTWVKEWQPLLTSRGAKVEASLQFPAAEQLDNTDVLVMFAANAGTSRASSARAREIPQARRRHRRPARLGARAGAALVQDDHRRCVGERRREVLRGREHLLLRQHGAPHHQGRVQLHDYRRGVLGSAHDARGTRAGGVDAPVRPARGAPPPPEPQIGKLIPQMWTYEQQLPGGQPYRAVVSLLGHHFTTFSSPHVRAIFLRAIAWAGKRDADALATQEEIAAIR